MGVGKVFADCFLSGLSSVPAMGLKFLRLSELFLMQVKLLVFPSARFKMEFNLETQGKY